MFIIDCFRQPIILFVLQQQRVTSSTGIQLLKKYVNILPVNNYILYLPCKCLQKSAFVKLEESNKIGLYNNNPSNVRDWRINGKANCYINELFGAAFCTLDKVR